MILADHSDKEEVKLTIGALGELSQMEDAEVDFVEEMVNNLIEYEDRMFLSNKQKAWLNKLEEKYLMHEVLRRAGQQDMF